MGLFRNSLPNLVACLVLVYIVALWGPESFAQDQVRVHGEGSSTRAAMVEATGEALRNELGQRVRFRPLRVATKGNWGFLGALPVEPSAEDLCYAPEAGFWMGAAQFHLLLYRFHSEWHVVELNDVCHEEVGAILGWAAFVGEDLIGTRFLDIGQY